MKILFLAVFFISTSWGESSKIIPVFYEAAQIYINDTQESLVVRPDIRSALKVLKQSKVNPSLLHKRLSNKNAHWPLRQDDKYDSWLNSKNHSLLEVPEIAVHAYKLDVDEPSDDFFKDDIYAYFFVTDGVIPTGKVTSIYKGLDANQSFFFTNLDRSIFPSFGINAKVPQNHLIIDYGIIESDGDDIKEMQAISSVIIDIAIAVYNSYDPENARILINLRKEVKALAEYLIALEDDDRLVTGTLGFKANDLEKMFKNKTYVEITKKHSNDSQFDSWQYRLSFRILKN